MKKTYKRLLGLSPILVVAPIVALVACGETKKQNEEIKPETKTVSQQAKDWSSFNKDAIWTDSFTSSDIAKNNFEVPEDGIYLVKDSYNGKLWDGTNKSGHEVTENVSRLYGGLFDKSVVELGDMDSLYLLYDKDDADGFTPSEFNNQFMFNDSSIMNSNELRAVNENYGNSIIKTRWGDVPHIMFKDGKSTQYVGSQSNHMGSMTFEQSMDKIKTEVTPEIFTMIQNYYTHASHIFMPVVHEAGMFTYERVSERAFKITYHYNTSSHNPITAATFKLYNKDKGISIGMGTMSMGDRTEWNSYENPSSGNTYYFQGRKNN